MAVVYGRKNSLKEKIDKKIPIYILLLFVLTVICGASIFYTEVPLFLISPVIWYVGIVYIRKVSSRNKRYKAGLTGEENVLRILKRLSNKYHIFTDINLKSNEGINKAQIDTVIVSNKGITIVEVKNIKGLAKGNVKDEYIEILKTDKSGREYRSQMYNPYKQVKGQSYKLSKYLKSKNIDTFVDGIVYFNRSEKKIKAFNIRGSKKYIFDKERKLLRRIKKNKNYLDDDELYKIIEVLSKISK